MTLRKIGGVDDPAILITNRPEREAALRALLPAVRYMLDEPYKSWTDNQIIKVLDISVLCWRKPPGGRMHPNWPRPRGLVAVGREWGSPEWIAAEKAGMLEEFLEGTWSPPD